MVTLLTNLLHWGSCTLAKFAVENVCRRTMYWTWPPWVARHRLDYSSSHLAIHNA